MSDLTQRADREMLADMPSREIQQLIRDLLAALALATEWQPIETAPMDATEVLLSDGLTYTRTGWFAMRVNKWSIDCATVGLPMPTLWAHLPKLPAKKTT